MAQEISRRTILDVPYKEKEQAKNLGAWWDPEIKKWFVPRGKDPEPFRRWIPQEQHAMDDSGGGS